MALVSISYQYRDWPASLSNYRSVSITSICSKLIEHIIFSQVMDHSDSHNILDDSQHGFRPGGSCESQLIITSQDLAKSLDNREQVDAIVLDFSKAFDRVPHQILLLKLKQYGIRDSLLDNFLTKRSQQVVVDGQSSEWAPVTSGVPQGTVLGPLLFLAFTFNINDLPASLTSKAHLFADDCLIYRSISSTTDAEALQADLNSLHQ